MVNSAKAWIQAFRLRTLPLALSCIGMGGFLAAAANAFRLDIFLLCVCTTILLQVLSNLANDYGDSIHGADNAERKGPSRAVQRGAISARQMKSAVILLVILCLISGTTLLLVSFGLNWNVVLFFLGLGIISILAAIAYTVGKKPYGYRGFGDIAVLIFFGLVGVLGSYYLFMKEVSWAEVLPAFSCGVFAMAVLNINNIRDIIPDRKAGKYSIPVRIGRENAVLYHWSLLTAGHLSAVAYTVIHYVSPVQLIFLLTAPIFISNGKAVSKKPPELLDPYLKQMALSTLLFVLLFGLGLILARPV
ncbi:MAG TPA: 1,4-dihydroxy-2-naphthoate polyprenyltransferase [Ohtaekwangia sp.]|nr:1,4-dihydroxy-2-naphthoate polyprenyltransferase [Ohtaekwangia sp.]